MSVLAYKSRGWALLACILQLLVILSHDRLVTSSNNSNCTSPNVLVTGGGEKILDGCYIPEGQMYNASIYKQLAEPILFGQLTPQSAHNTTYNAIFKYANEWRIGIPGVVAYYSSTCDSESPPGYDNEHPYWKTERDGTTPPPNLFGPLGKCIQPPNPPPVKNCSCTACTQIWGPSGCPDLHTVAPDLVRPPMVNGTPGAGRRVRMVQASFAGTEAYHALYLPKEWKPQATRPSNKTYPVIIEYMGNGPWHDNLGDVSTGRPEDSNLGETITSLLSR